MQGESSKCKSSHFGLVSLGRYWCQAMKVSTAAVTQVPKAAKGHGLDVLILLRSFKKVEGQCGISICDRTTSTGRFVLSQPFCSLLVLQVIEV